MQKNYILSLFFLLSFVTFVKSQDLAHTLLSTDRSAHLAFDSRSMEKFIAENPSLFHQWNRPSILSNNQLILCDNSISFVSFTQPNLEMNSYELFLQKTAQGPKQMGDLGYVNNINSCTLTGLLSHSVVELAKKWKAK